MTAAGDLDQVAGNVRRFAGDAVRRAVVDLKKPLLAQARKDSGGDLRLSRVGRARLRVDTKVTGTINVTGQVTAGPRTMRGPWRWLNDGTRPRPQGRGRHPGTRPKMTWDGPALRTIPQVERRIVAQFEQAVR